LKVRTLIERYVNAKYRLGKNMKVSSIQSYNPSFSAKLNVLGKFFVAEELNVLTNKADKVGFENDIVELNYTNYRDKSIEFLNEKTPDYLKKISSLLKARFIPNGEGIGTEIYKECASGDSYREFWDKENKIANRYLDRLVEKYPNERLGVSIIEN
jgi:hypothetical protein